MKSVFPYAIQFTMMIIEQFSLSTNSVRIGVITFSETAEILIPFDKHKSVDQLQKDIDSLPYIGYRTRIGEAFQMATTRLFDTRYGTRDDAKKIVVLITDGRDTFDTANDELRKAHETSQRLLASNTTIAAIGMFGTHKTDVQTLRYLTGREEDIYLIENAPDLLSLSFLRGFSHNYCV